MNKIEIESVVFNSLLKSSWVLTRILEDIGLLVYAALVFSTYPVLASILYATIIIIFWANSMYIKKILEEPEYKTNGLVGLDILKKCLFSCIILDTIYRAIN